MAEPQQNAPFDDTLTPDMKTDRHGRSNSEANPYGPHPHGVDKAAGGADSSPYENEPGGEQRDVAAGERAKGRTGASHPADDRSP